MNSSCLVVSYVRKHCLVVVLSQLLIQGFLEFLHNHGSLQSLLLSLYSFSMNKGLLTHQKHDYCVSNTASCPTSSVCYPCQDYCSLRLRSSSPPLPMYILVVQPTHLAWLQPSASPTTQYIVPPTLDLSS